MNNIKIYITKPKDIHWGRNTIEFAIFMSDKVLYYNSKMVYQMLNKKLDNMMFYFLNKDKKFIFFHEVNPNKSNFFTVIDFQKITLYKLNLDIPKNKHLYNVVIYDLEIIGLGILEKYDFAESIFVKDNFKLRCFNIFKWKSIKI